MDHSSMKCGVFVQTMEKRTGRCGRERSDDSTTGCSEKSEGI